MAVDWSKILKQDFFVLVKVTQRKGLTKQQTMVVIFGIIIIIEHLSMCAHEFIIFVFCDSANSEQQKLKKFANLKAI